MRYLIINNTLLHSAGAPMISYIEARSTREAARKFVNRFFKLPTRGDIDKYFKNSSVEDYKDALVETCLEECVIVDADTVDTVM